MFKKIIAVLLFLINVNTFAEPSNQEWKITQLSAENHFETMLICTTPPAVGSFQACQLKIFVLDNEIQNQESKRTATILKNARVSVEGGMPAHHHGLPSSPVVSWSESDGAYVVKGLKFSMPGEWLLRFYIYAEINKNDKDDKKNSDANQIKKEIKDKVSFKFSI